MGNNTPADRCMMDYEKAYGQMHEAVPKDFSGYSIKGYVKDIAALVDSHGIIRPDAWQEDTRLLDYGSGKGYQYLGLRVHEQWGGILPVCYDPGVYQLRTKPDKPSRRRPPYEGKFAGIICTDVMEHIEEADVDAVLADIFRFADDHGFVFFVIGIDPSYRKKLPDGRDVHVTVKPPTWWDAKLAKYQRDGLTIRVIYEKAKKARIP